MVDLEQLFVFKLMQIFCYTFFLNILKGRYVLLTRNMVGKTIDLFSVIVDCGSTSEYSYSMQVQEIIKLILKKYMKKDL